MKRLLPYLGLVVGIIGVLSPMIWGKINKPKLKIELRSSISILEKDPILENISVYFEDKRITNLIKYQFVIQNIGNIPINKSDIISLPTLTFGNSARIIAYDINSKSFRDVEFSLQTDTTFSFLTFNFPLLNSSDFVEFVVYVTDCINCKPDVSARITGISNIFIEDKTLIKPETVKSLSIFHYLAIAIALLFLILLICLYNDARQHSKVKKMLRKNSDFLDKINTLSELKEFIATNMYFTTDDEKKELNNIFDDESTDVNNKIYFLKIKIKGIIQETGGAQIVVYAAIIILIAVVISILFRLFI